MIVYLQAKYLVFTGSFQHSSRLLGSPALVSALCSFLLWTKAVYTILPEYSPELIALLNAPLLMNQIFDF